MAEKGHAADEAGLAAGENRRLEQRPAAGGGVGDQAVVEPGSRLVKVTSSP